ncbi:MAG: hypothetical protein ACLP52_27795 [Streptosporangiaceae bacterium]
MFEPDFSVFRRLPYPPGRATETLPFDIADLPQDLQISVGWTAAVGAAESDIAALASDVPFFSYSAVGFLNEELDPSFRGSGLPSFGVILYADDAGFDVPIDTLKILRFSDVDTVLPVIVRRGIWQQHQWRQAQPPTVTGAQLACWATSRGGARQGWLTARHAAVQGVGTPVDAATDCTDAALVAIGPEPWINQPATAAYRSLAAGVSAELHFSQRSLTATVLDVSSDFGISKSPKFPVRFSLSQAGVAGNSGAYITESSSGQPLGLYLGAFLPANAALGRAPSGYGLAIYQLESMMNLEVYP